MLLRIFSAIFDGDDNDDYDNDNDNDDYLDDEDGDGADKGRTYIGEDPYKPEREFNNPISAIALHGEYLPCWKYWNIVILALR